MSDIPRNGRLMNVGVTRDTRRARRPGTIKKNYGFVSRRYLELCHVITADNVTYCSVASGIIF